VFTDPHLVAREMAVEVEHPTLGRMRSLGSAIKMSETPTDPRRRAPLLGEHTEEVLAGSGFTVDEISSLRAAGAIG
jgi:crotonobetainyl-CoA:carnitine CoA-transferase CaiB-like acyl-CoA transferase